MSNWRPDDWRNYRSTQDPKSFDDCILVDKLNGIFEAGADAYGEALKKEGLHCDQPMTEELMRFIAHTAAKHDGKPGTWVFIPDDKQEG